MQFTMLKCFKRCVCATFIDRDKLITTCVGQQERQQFSLQSLLFLSEIDYNVRL